MRTASSLGRSPTVQVKQNPYREGLSFFTINTDAARKNNVFAVWEASLKLGGSFGVQERAVANSLSSATHRYTCRILKPTTVQFLNKLGLANKRPVHQRP